MAQRALVYAVLFLLAFDLCDADCKFVMKTDSDCIDNGMSYVIGLMWKSEDCYTCYCGKVTAICCTEYVTPPDVPYDCEAVFDKKLCRYKIYNKDNPDILCD
ncbi:beta-microseminoprotein-like [Heptranchias perlo]|uniref:beta-microseminoprotein-like n=1 Tax=Heptranchias perlo TaxID=212740 RepID=UPI003559CF46